MNCGEELLNGYVGAARVVLVLRRVRLVENADSKVMTHQWSRTSSLWQQVGHPLFECGGRRIGADHHSE